MPNNNETILTQTVRIVDSKKQTTEPYTIKDNFVTLVCFHQAEVEKIVTKGKTEKTVKVTERTPLMIIWDGSEVSYAYCDANQDIVVADEKFIVDREIDETPLMPSSEFIIRLLSPKGKKMVKDFNPKDLFTEVEQYFRDYFYLPHPMLYKVVALFVINQWVFDAHASTPYLYIRSPEKGCGKSHFGQSIIEMCNGVMATSMKAHHIFRSVHGTKAVLGFDEMKSWQTGSRMDKETAELLELVNVGFQRDGGRAPRLLDMGNGKYKTEWFDSYAPKVFITTNTTLPSDTQSRCIEVIMQRAMMEKDDYGDRWYDPKRKIRLKKIREMGALFRLKCGMEIKAMSEDQAWRSKLDLSDEFKGLNNRDLEIFRPLVISCLMYMPEWKELLAHHVRKHIDSRSRLETTDTTLVLYALKSIYQSVKTGWYQPGEENLMVTLENNSVDGDVLYCPIGAIIQQIEKESFIAQLGKNPASRVGRKLTDLGFTTGSIRKAFGMVRVLKVSTLRDLCERYLGKPLLEEEKPEELSQQEKISLVRETMLKYKDGVSMEELYALLDYRIPAPSLDAIMNQLKKNGYVQEFGRVIAWVI